MRSDGYGHGYNYTIPVWDRQDYVTGREQMRPNSTATATKYKEAERKQLAADIAAFEAQGGRIERIGVTPIQQAKSARAQERDRYLQQRAKGRATRWATVDETEEE